MEENKVVSKDLFNSIKVVLVGTTHPGNIGASARAMKNMGLLNLALVTPKEFPSDAATYRSKAAKDVLENAQVFENLKDAVADCELVIGTSARDRKVPWPVLNPKESAEEVAKSAQHHQIAIVFGREDRGLTNEELGLCNLHVHIPSDPEYSSLNLSQAVQILTYEIRLCLLQQQKNQDNWDVELANNQQTERLIAHMDELMQEVEFYDIDNPRLQEKGRSSRIAISTDAPDDYLIRSKDPGEFKVIENGKDITNQSGISFGGSNGKWHLTLPPMEQKESVYFLNITDIDRERIVDPFQIQFYMKEVPKIVKSKQKKKKKPKLKSNMSIKPPIHVHENDYEYYNFDHNDLFMGREEVGEKGKNEFEIKKKDS